MSKALRLFLLGCCLLLFVNATAQAQDLTIALIPRSLGNPIFLDAFEAAQKKAYELDVRLEWVSSPDFDGERQIEIIENLIRRGVDGIMASVNDEEPMRQVIQKALDA